MSMVTMHMYNISSDTRYKSRWQDIASVMKEGVVNINKLSIYDYGSVYWVKLIISPFSWHA